MSNIYINEPTTHGKVLLQTTFGDLDIELWSRECPIACRNFVQLCMENYYNGTIIHRIIKNFIGQGGDPLGTGFGGDSIYGKPFKDEFHQRLRFIRPGLVAMANSGPNDNASQFFLTLGATPDLQNKHTIFGKVSGDTKYNLLKLNEIQTDKDERPLQPPKIRKTIILSNPFPDIVPRLTAKEEAQLQEVERKEAANKILSTKSFNLLSFGDEAEEDEVEIATISNKDTKKMSKSMHDLIDDPLLLKEPAIKNYNDIDDNTDINESTYNQKQDKSEQNFKKDSFKEKLENIKNRSNLSHSIVDTNNKLGKFHECFKNEIDDDSNSQNVISNGRDLNDKSNNDNNNESEDNEENEYSSELSKNALNEYVNSNKIYKERKKTLPIKGPKREQQTLTLLSTFRQKLQHERHNMLKNAKLKSLDNGEEIEIVEEPKPRRLTKRERFAKMQEALKNPEHLTEQYPELRLWEDKEYDELAQEQAIREQCKNDDKDPHINELLTHKFVCSDDSDLSDEADNYPVFSVKKKGAGKKKFSHLQHHPGTLGDEEEDEESGKSDSSGEEVNDDYHILKKTNKDACSIKSHEYYDIYDPRNPINVRRREGVGESLPSFSGKKNTSLPTVDAYYNPLDPSYSADAVAASTMLDKQHPNVNANNNTSAANYKFFASKQQPNTIAGVKTHQGPTTDHAKNMKEFLKSRSTFRKNF